ncbi:Sjogren's syndrome/scleroderma autoantigen 1 family protein [Natribaculum luteum]|uniref:Sjogren's syndrome/scleroderma autoantigen 1 family protein n=1 Tax=Natribaculum luteum TaxID=1586232 RepID=A0ABD5NWP1_9EURY|nr:Sjogren's syndrome/scleroderma autoantigen 1 family protein [Natribaculum luteum]
MSDFDKEAEREKLREKYERDQADREATQRMSDLLLKGATMTNVHCDTCGDPLFKQNGQTFCPSCHGSPEAVQGTDLESDATAADDSVATADATESTTNVDATEPATNADATAAEPTDADEQATTETRSRETSTWEGVRTPPSQASDSRGAESSADAVDRRSGSSDRPATTRRVDGDLEGGRAALAAALERFAREAAETDDPRYAKECLEAAREASEALAALRR